MTESIVKTSFSTDNPELDPPTMTDPSPTPDEFVVKRDGRHEPIDYNKITRRLKRLKADVEKALGRPLRVSVFRIAQSTIRQIYSGITTSELDEEAAEVAAGISDDPDYIDFAGSILASNLEANNRDNLAFSKYAEIAYSFVEEKSQENCPLISKQLYDIAQKYGHLIDRQLVMERNLLYGYFAFKTLAKGGYLLSAYRTVQRNRTTRRAMVPFETPQHALMRVALGIHGNNLDAAFELYDRLSRKHGTMATPTLFFSGTQKPQMSSCYLLQMRDDALSAIFDTLKDCAMISKDAGGIGVHIHNIRATGSYIKGTNGTSNGLVPMLRVFNNTAKYVDQCFHPDTIVYTLTGPKPIGEVTYNDRVITHDGSAQRVIKVLHHHYKGPVLKLATTQSLESTMVTPKHPIWRIPDQGNLTNQEIIERLERGSIVPEYTEVDQLEVHDLIGYPLPTFCEDAPWFSESDCRMLGILFMGGSLEEVVSVDNDTNKAHSRMIVHMNLERPKHKKALEFIKMYCAAKLLEVEEDYDEEKEMHRIEWELREHFPITEDMMHNDTLPAFVLHLPEPKVQQVLAGIFDLMRFENELDLSTIPKTFMHQLLYMFMRLKIPYLRQFDRLRIFKTKALTDILGLEPDDPSEELLEWKGMVYSRLMFHQTLEYSGTLVDFHIENNTNYLTQLGLAKNGGGKRAGSFAIYLEPWHADIMEFLDLKRPHGAEDQRARDLFYALWVPDLFFKRVMQGMDTLWSLMDPKVCPGLSDVYGDEFERLYEKYESEKKYVKQIKIGQVIEAILTTQIETGTPYIMSKDACNRKTNQKNLGTIKSSNLCVTGQTEILTKEYGHVPIATVVGQQVHVWNGKQWSQTQVVQTSLMADIFRVEFSDGSHIDCTDYHKFFVGEPDPQTGLGRVVQASDLKQGDHITPFRLPGHDQPFDKVYVHSVKPLKAGQPTYCFNELIRHAGVFNGILTGNCTEIVEYSSSDESAVCNLSSLSLPAFVDVENKSFNYQELFKATRVFLRALDRVIDVNAYPLESARKSNMLHRPVGLGVQGLADVFCLMGVRYGSDASKRINRDIAETMYFAAMTESHALAVQLGPYPSIDFNGGAPIRHGIFQFDMWKDDFKGTDNPDGWKPNPALGWDWESLRTKVMRDGVRNSLTIAPMPTASTSIVLGNVESFEPYYGMIYVRSTKSGEFYQMCRPLIEELIKRKIWVASVHPTTGKSYIPIKDRIMAEHGSIQNIEEIPQELKDVFVSVMDIKLKDITEMARDRGVFTDQSMSLNVHFRNKDNMTIDLLKYMLFAWRLGLKTISYYTRTIQDQAALNFTGNSVKEKECLTCSA